MDNLIVKNCQKCGPLVVSQTWKDGRHLRCKKCRSEHNRAKYAKFRERNKERKQAYRDENRDKINEQARIWRLNNKEKLKEQYAAGYKGRPYTKTFGRLLKQYNISWEKYLEMQEPQNNCCNICKSPETRKEPKSDKICRLSIDHCHEKNVVRELLCAGCNSALGMLNHDIGLHEKALAYLQKHSDAA